MTSTRSVRSSTYPGHFLAPIGEGPPSDSLADSVLDRFAIDTVFRSGEAPLAISDLSGTIIVANAAASQILGSSSPRISSVANSRTSSPTIGT